MGRRMMRTLGAGLMEAGKQGHIYRKEQLEERRQENLVRIADEKLGLMREGLVGQTEYQDRMAGVAETNAASQAQSVTNQGEYQGKSLDNQAAQLGIAQSSADATGAHQSWMQTHATETADAAALAAKLQAGLTEQRLGTESDQVALMQSEAAAKEMRTFTDVDVKAAVTDNLDIKSLEEAAQYKHLMSAFLADPTYMTANPEQFKKMVDTIKQNMGVDPDKFGDITKLDAEGAKRAVNQLLTKAKLLKIPVEAADIDTLMLPHLKPPEVAPEAPPASAGMNFDEGRGRLSDRNAIFNPQLSSADNAAEWLMQATTTPDDLTYGTGPMKRGISSGDPDDIAMIQEAIGMIEENWDVYSKRYGTSETFEEYLPKIRAKLDMPTATPGDNPQSGIGAGLMNGIALPKPGEPAPWDMNPDEQFV